jgi:hypothetical protein
MNRLPWFERMFDFPKQKEMLPFYLERLEGTIPRIEHKTKNLDDKILSTKYNDKWSIKQNIGHLAEVDQVNNRRVDEILSGITVLSPAVFEPMDYNPWPIEKVIEYFREHRLSNISKYRNLSSIHLSKSSVHPRLKVIMTPVDLAYFDAEHDDHHLLKISDILYTFNT